MIGEPCAVCGEPAIVKVGQAEGVLVDLCQAHLDQYLEQAANVVRDLISKLRADQGKKTDELPGVYDVGHESDKG